METRWETERKKAKCNEELDIDQSESLFWLGQGGSPLKAKAFCAECPIQKFCKNYAIVHDEYGIWGGTTRKERLELLAAMPGLQEKLTEKARREGWLEEHR